MGNQSLIIHTMRALKERRDVILERMAFHTHVMLMAAVCALILWVLYFFIDSKALFVVATMATVIDGACCVAVRRSSKELDFCLGMLNKHAERLAKLKINSEISK